MANLFILLIALIYIFDEKINAVLGYNFYGFLFILILCTLRYHLLRLSFSVFMICSLLTLYSLLIAFLSPCELTYKSIISTLLLLPFFILLNARYINKIIIKDFISKFSLMILIISILLNELFYQENRLFRLFYENSWIGLYASPFIIYRLLSDIKDRYSWFAILIVSLFCFSTTFFIIMSLLFLIILVKSKSVVYIFHFVLLMLIYFSLNSIAIMDRLYTILNYANHSSGNLSSFVWLNGFSLAYHNFIATSGLGVGLNQMGCISSAHASSNFSSVIENITGGILLNSEDGSFLSSKLISEFGFLGLLIVIGLVTLVMRNLLLYIFSKSPCAINLDCIVGSIILLVLLFIRAGGYYQLIVVLSLSLFFSGPYVNRVDRFRDRK